MVRGSFAGTLYLLGAVVTVAPLGVLFVAGGAAGHPVGFVTAHVVLTSSLALAAAAFAWPGRAPAWALTLRPVGPWLLAASVGDLQFVLFAVALAAVSPAVALALFQLFPVWLLVLVAVVPAFRDQRRAGLRSAWLWAGLAVCVGGVWAVAVAQHGVGPLGPAAGVGRIPSWVGWSVGVAAGAVLTVQVASNRRAAWGLRAAAPALRTPRGFLASELLTFGAGKAFAAAALLGCLVGLDTVGSPFGGGWAAVQPYVPWAMGTAVLSVGSSMLLRVGLELHPSAAGHAVLYAGPAFGAGCMWAAGYVPLGDPASLVWVLVGVALLVAGNVVAGRSR